VIVTDTRNVPYAKLSLLGIITIAVYGSWYYAFGAMLDAILLDTGWRESTLTGAFAAGGFLTGIGALGGGRLLDFAGSRVVFAAAALLGFTSFQIAAGAESVVMFVAASVVGSGVFGALGFYHITQTVAVRLSPGVPHAAIAIVTMWGAFASTVYLPLTAWLVADAGWRTAIRVTTASAAVVLLAGAILIPSPGLGRRQRTTGSLLSAVRAPAAARFLGSVAVAGVAISIVLVYQIPAMTGAGLSLRTAALVAALRGVMQLGGRLPVAWMARRLGTTRSYRYALAVLAAGIVLLPVSGNIVVALVFAVAAGFGIGAFSPLQGMQATEEFDPRILGSALGVAAFAFAVGGALGPAVAGFLSDSTGSRSWPIALAAIAAMVAAAQIRPAGGGRVGPG
jgi:predicted MFS family arabinose efflux permease